MALRAYMTLKGSKQGAFKGESTSERHAGKSPIRSFAYEVTASHDLATGQARGRLQHKPVTIVKQFGPASPQLLQALISNERLSEVVFEFYATDPYGQEVLRYTIKGLNGSVTNVRLFTDDTTHGAPDSGTPGGVSDPGELEEVSFILRRIEIEHLTGKTLVVDDWGK